MKFHRIGVLVAATAAATLSFGSGAAIAAPNSPSLVPGGYRLVTSFQYTAPPNSQTFGQVTCPGHEQPSGGGVFDDGGSDGINSSYPSGHSWDAYVNNPTSTSGGFLVFAVCLSKNISYQVVDSVFTATNGTQSTGFVACPSGKVVGGGAYVSSNSTAADVNSSIPVSNGWRADINNTSGADTTAIVYAVCHPKPRGYSIHIGTSVTVTPGEFDALASVACGPSATNVAIGGGGFSSSSSTSVQTQASFPNGQQGWSMDEVNNSASNNTETPYAICAGT
jgi:hypothetical protein